MHLPSPLRRRVATIALLLAIVAALPPLSPSIAARSATPATPAPPAPPATPDATPSAGDDALYAPIIADQRDAIQARTAGRLSRYVILAELRSASVGQSATIEGSIDYHFVNETGEAQSALPFRLYANAEEYADGGVTIDSASVEGRSASPALSVGDTLATLQLPSPVPPGGSADLSLAFTTTVPTDPVASYGMFAYDSASETYALAHWMPILAGWDPETGWLLDPPSRNGDPIFSDVSLYDLTLTTPADLVVATTGGAERISDAHGRATYNVLTGPVRDLVIAASPRFVTRTRQVGATTVTSYAIDYQADGGQQVLDNGVQALAVYSDAFGVYPYREFDLVEIPLGNGAGGVEFPGLVFIGSDYYGPGIARAIPGYLEFIVAHEVSHQWFYGLVGNAQYRHAFLDEGLVNYSTTRYFAAQHDEAAAEQQVNLELKLPYFQMLFGSGDQIVDQPTDDFPTMGTYGSTIYGKGALGFQAIREAIGGDAYDRAIKRYVNKESFLVAVPADLQAAFEQASGRDLSELWRHWFDSAEGSQDFDAADLTALFQALGR